MRKIDVSRKGNKDTKEVLVSISFGKNYNRKAASQFMLVIDEDTITEEVAKHIHEQIQESIIDVNWRLTNKRTEILAKGKNEDESLERFKERQKNHVKNILTGTS
jgi:hypothetical protein